MNRHDRRAMRKQGNTESYIKHLESQLSLAMQTIEIMKANGIQPPQIMVDHNLPPGVIKPMISVENARNIAAQHFQEGWEEAWAVVQNSVSPLTAVLIEVNSIVANIRGIATAGRGELPREQVATLVEVLAHRLGDLDIRKRELAAALGANPEDVLVPDSLAKAHDFYDAAAIFTTTGDDSKLLELIESTNSVLAEHVQLRKTIRPGATTKTVRLNEWLFRHARELKDKNGGTWNTIAELLISRKDSDSYDDQQRQQLIDLERHFDPSTYLRQGWAEVKERDNVGKSLLRHTNETS